MVLQEIDSSVTNGCARVSLYSYIKIIDFKADEFIREHLTGYTETLVPDTFAYKVKLHDIEIQDCRLFVAKSISKLFPDAIYAEFAIEYVATSFPGEIVKRISKDYQQTLGLIGLKINNLF